MLALDGGDALFKEVPIPSELAVQWHEKAEIIASAYARALDAFVPGELDVAEGTEAFVALAHKHNLPVIAANLVESSGAPVFPAHVVKQVGGVRALVVGVVSPNGWPKDAPIKATDPATALKAAVERAPEHDVAILVAHAPVEETSALARAVPVFSFAMCSHSGQMFFQPRTIELGPGGKVESTLVFGSGKGGKYVSKLRAVMKGGNRTFVGGEKRSGPRFALETAEEKLKKNPGNSTARAEADRAKAALWEMERSSFADYDLAGMEKYLPEDADIAKRVTQYNDVNAAREAQVAAQSGNGKAEVGKLPPGGLYVGAVVCQACHLEQYNAWQKQDHSHAMASLRKSNQQLDRECIGCHSTGYKQPGGYADPAHMGGFAEVQCEACHGPGRMHVDQAGGKGTISRASGQETCLKCHTPEATPQFRYGPDRERIRHWKGK
ncbi:MAG: multiheme c-type cytochrome [Myxococcota bacterium]